MSNALTGSRYELRVSRGGVRETHGAKSYRDVYRSDTETNSEFGDPVGYVHSIEIGSTVDGPGIRFVLFLTGCPLRCQFCHNPDTWHKANGRRYTLDKTMKEIGKYSSVLTMSRGGLTISGGEPMMQEAFTSAVFRRTKLLGMHTCLDTSGLLGSRLSDATLDDIDLTLLDIKSGDPAAYERVTGQPLEPTLAYARRLSERGRPMWVRFVLVPDLTDDHDNVERIADICAGLRSLERVEVLRFHQMGLEKYRKLKTPYPLEHTKPPTPELTERVREQFRSRGLTVF